MKATFTTVFTAFLIAGTLCSHNSTAQKYRSSLKGVDSVELQKVTVNKLVRKMNKWDGKYIEVEGYFLQGRQLFAIGESKHKDNSYKVWLDTNPELYANWNELTSKKVSIRGKYKASRKGYLGMYKGTLENVYFVEEI